MRPDPHSQASASVGRPVGRPVRRPIRRPGHSRFRSTVATRLAALLTVTILSLAVLLSACATAAFAVSTQDTPPASVHPAAVMTLEERLSTHMKFLTSDFCLGRVVGTGAGTRAAQYVIDEFKSIGLSPIYKGSYARTYKIPDIAETSATLELLDSQGKAAKSFASGKDFMVGAYSKWGSNAASGPLALVPATTSGWDDVKAGSVLLGTYTGGDVSSILNPATQKKCAAVLLLNTAWGDKPLSPTSNTKPSGINMIIDVVSQSCRDELAKNLGGTVRLTVNSKSTTWTGVNVVGALGDPSKQTTVVVCAHRDALGGADGRLLPTQGGIDNASGTSALLEIARALKSDPEFKAAAVFVAADGEEIGLTGSKAFAQDLPFNKQNLTLVVNMDCIGVQGSDVVELYATKGSPGATEVRDIALANLKAAGFNPVTSEENYASDQRPFEEMGCPAIVVHATRDAYSPYIHTPKDTVDTVDPKALAAIVRAVTDGIVKGLPRGQ